MTTIRIGSAPDAYQGHGLLLDGENAQPRKASLSIDEGRQTLLITLSEEETLSWPLDAIRKLRDQAGGDMMVLMEKGDALRRLVLTTAEDRRIAHARAKNLRRSPPVTGKRRLTLWGAGAVGSVALMVFALIPFLANNLATLLPPAGERALGETVFEQVRTAFDTSGTGTIDTCESPAGRAALDSMEARLFPDLAAEDAITLHVLDNEMVNAFALPGGIVVLMRGLIDEAASAEEVAAVYAHEVGHVVARDPSRIALRSAGSAGVLGLLFGDFAGGAAVLFLTNQLIQANYTREAEAAADVFAHDALRNAGVRPDAIAGFFERLLEEYGDADELAQAFLSHPLFSERIAAAREATPGSFTTQPVLTEKEWADLRAICAG